MRENTNNNMDSFYDDNAQFTGNNSLKRPLTLDLNNPKNPKRQRFNQSVTAAPVLSSPDLHMLKLASPELEKIILNAANLPTPTPLVFPTKVTTEQEDYARGFEDALNNLHKNENPKINAQQPSPPQQQSSQSSTKQLPITSSTAAITLPTNATTVTTVVTNTMSGGGITYTNLENFPVAIKDEPQTVPQSPQSLSPIDMESQERIKLERKRQRNRVAASKCRKRKLERISKLEDKVKILKGENAELGNLIGNLRQNVCQLKQQVLEHMNAGCTITITGQI